VRLGQHIRQWLLASNYIERPSPSVPSEAPVEAPVDAPVDAPVEAPVAALAVRITDASVEEFLSILAS
jgi:hypothetical protein